MAGQDKHLGSSFDDFLCEEGIYEEVTATAKERWYELLEQKLDSLLRHVESQFSVSEINEVTVSLNAREYGLALETLIGVIVEEHKPVSAPYAAEVNQLADKLDLEPRFRITRP